jgi:hypothetical protein
VALKGTGFDPEPWFSKNFQRTGQETPDLCQIFEVTHWFFVFFQKPITIDSYFILTFSFSNLEPGVLEVIPISKNPPNTGSYLKPNRLENS